MPVPCHLRHGCAFPPTECNLHAAQPGLRLWDHLDPAPRTQPVSWLRESQRLSEPEKQQIGATWWPELQLQLNHLRLEPQALGSWGWRLQLGSIPYPLSQTFYCLWSLLN